MKKEYEIRKKYPIKWFYGVIVICLLFVYVNSKDVQAETKTITLKQDHLNGKYDENGLDDYYYYLYPDDKFKDYKKFMKYTYKISDDSVIGLRINGNVDFNSWIIDEDENGNQIGISPNDIKVHALGPGTATLKVYNGKKLIDSYSFTVVADETYSTSSFVNNADNWIGDYSIGSDKENKLVKKFALEAADQKYTTTNQRIAGTLNASIAYGGKLVSQKKFEEMTKDDTKDIYYTALFYHTPYSRLIDKIATAQGYATVNKSILNNLGFSCTVETYVDDPANNYVEIYKKNENYAEELQDRELFYKLYNDKENSDEFDEMYGELYEDDVYPEIKEGEFDYAEFTATTKLTSDYDFSAEEDESIYKRTHLPAWIIGEDTVQQVIDVGQTISLSSSDMNDNIFSSDSSVVKAENGKITGVKPGVALVYRYNDTYCDVFLVLVNRKGTAKTIQTKIYTKSVKSYFTSSDYAPYILGGKIEACKIDDWQNLRIYELEPIFGHGGAMITEYSKGKIKCYVEYEGKSELLCTIGSGKYAD